MVDYLALLAVSLGSLGINNIKWLKSVSQWYIINGMFVLFRIDSILCPNSVKHHIKDTRHRKAMIGYHLFVNFTSSNDFSNSPYSIQWVTLLGRAIQIFYKLGGHWMDIESQIKNYFNLSSGSMVITLPKIKRRIKF